MIWPPKSTNFTDTSGHKASIYCMILLTDSPEPNKKLIHSVIGRGNGYLWEKVNTGALVASWGAGM